MEILTQKEGFAGFRRARGLKSQLPSLLPSPKDRRARLMQPLASQVSSSRVLLKAWGKELKEEDKKRSTSIFSLT